MKVDRLVGGILFLIFINIEFNIAQTDLKSGFLLKAEPKISLPKNWKINSKLETRQIFWQSNEHNEMLVNYQFERTDLAAVFCKQLNSQSIGIGYLLRIKEQKLTHRYIQVYATKQKLINWRLSHRFMSDQTFEPEQSMKLRFRYRLGIKRPLHFGKEEPSRFYLKLNQEVLFLIENKQLDLELRLSPLLGYKLNAFSALELGVDSRINGFNVDKRKGQLWLYVGFVQHI
jgi:hypothetical protein